MDTLQNTGDQAPFGPVQWVSPGKEAAKMAKWGLSISYIIISVFGVHAYNPQGLRLGVL